MALPNGSTSKPFPHKPEEYLGLALDLVFKNASVLLPFFTQISLRRPSQRLFRRAGLCTHHQPISLHNLGPALLWIDYVPSKSNSADAPSRFHEMTREAIYYFGERLAWRSIYGSYTCAGDSGWPMAIILRDCIFDLGVGTPYSYNVLCAIVSSAGCHFRQRLL